MPLAGTLSLAATEWDMSAGFGGTYVYSGGNNAETTSWGPSAGVGYQLSEPLHIRGDLQHTQARLLYDGLGGIAKQSMTGVGPGISWDILEDFNLDAEYVFRFGENSYAEHEAALALVYSRFEYIRFGADASYSRRDYVFPVTGIAVASSSRAFTLEVTPTPNSVIELPLSASVVTSEFSTNNSAYSVYTGSGGVTLAVADRRLRIGAGFSPGFDSSNYSLLGGDFRIGYKINQHLGVRAFASYTSYSFTASQSAKGKRQSGAAVNPLGNTDSFEIIVVGLSTTYNF